MISSTSARLFWTRRKLPDLMPLCALCRFVGLTGWATLNGRDMFANQGGAQFTLWTGFPLPEAAFRALDDAVSRHDSPQYSAT